MTKAYNISTVTSDDNDIRLDRWFKRHDINIPFSLLAKLVRKKSIKLNNKKAKIDQKICEGDVIQYPNLKMDVKHEKKADVIDEESLEGFKKSIFFEDDNIIAISKPPGVATQGGSGLTESVDSISREYYKEAEFTPKLVHRIDMDTSGLLILAKSSNVAAKITECFRNNEVEKTYLAIVYGAPRPREGDIKDIEQIEKDGRTRNIKSVSAYKTIDYAADMYAVLELKPESGRKHQLRKHCLKIGTPIMGDSKYYDLDLEIIKDDYLYLHAYKASFQIMGKQYDLETKPHEYFYAALKDLGLDLDA